MLRDFNMLIEANTTVAIAGTSGSGKSTIIQLLERFYDVNHGEIFLDDRNIKEYNLKYLREKMALVLQEPKLFDDTIKNNILLNIKYI